jgi:hypothetical protein
MGTERKVATGVALKLAIGLGIVGTAAFGGAIAVGIFLAKRSKRYGKVLFHIRPWYKRMAAIPEPLVPLIGECFAPL